MSESEAITVGQVLSLVILGGLMVAVAIASVIAAGLAIAGEFSRDVQVSEDAASPSEVPP